MIPNQLPFLANHLWQSTMFAAVAGLLTLALRKNRAQMRYWLWLSASVKFLIPFSLLVDLGGHFGGHTASPSVPRLSFVLEQASQPFVSPAPVATTQVTPANSLVNWVPALLYVVWAMGFALLICFWWRRWQRLRAALRTASPLDLQIGIKAMTSPAFAEPGVFGIRHPVLLLPDGITDRLTPLQLKAIVSHELCHARRRDNLASAIHMGVEALFWFHPLVWWLGARLMEERERACDEAVLLMGNQPEVYAEGILRICELYLESPLPCVSGATGSNLKRRIEDVMHNRPALRLGFLKRVTLMAAGVVALAGPVSVGLLNAPAIQAQPQAAARRPEFEVASIKLDKSAELPIQLGPIGNGRFRTTNIPLQELITMAYRIRDFQLVGAPAWLRSERYDVDARADAKAGFNDLTAMLQPLLEDRLQLKFHLETKELPVYLLAVSKPGKLIDAPGECPPPPGGPAALPDPSLPHGPCGFLFILPGHLVGQKVAISRLLDALSRLTDRVVLDKTKLTARYDIDLRYTPALVISGPSGEAGFAPPPGAPALPPTDPHGPSLFTALQEQLGLKLIPARGPVEFMVIDHIERPSEN
jgi:bla regulator protein blaR1